MTWPETRVSALFHVGDFPVNGTRLLIAMTRATSVLRIVDEAATLKSIRAFPS